MILALAAAELRQRFAYVATQQRNSKELEQYESIVDIPHLGFVNARSAMNTRSYQLLDTTLKPEIEVVDLVQGGKNYFVQQNLNPAAVRFEPSGQYDDSTFLSGRLATLGQHRLARQLFSVIRREFTKTFTFTGNYWMGREACQLWASGMRFTSDVSASRRIDVIYHK